MSRIEMKVCRTCGKERFIGEFQMVRRYDRDEHRSPDCVHCKFKRNRKGGKRKASPKPAWAR